MDDQGKGFPAYPVLGGACAAALFGMFAAAGTVGNVWLWLLAAFAAVLFTIGSLVVRSLHPAVLSRRWGRNPGRSWDRTLLLPAVLLYPATAALGAADLVRGIGPALAGWTVIPGFFLLTAGYVMIIQSLQADAPHAREHYGEAPRENGDKGAYEILRHPIELGALMLGLSLPLLLYSAVAFIPAGLQAILLISYVTREDNWRFHEYEWFYEYTGKTPHRMFPFIW